MSEWLTTGEMIDRLKVGEVAENQLGWKVKYQKKNDLYLWDNKDDLGEESNEKFTVHSHWVKQDKWRILPKYVTFEEAMNALRKGRTVKYLGLRGVFSHIISPHEFETHGIGVTALKESGLRHMLDGKWQIIE